MNYGGREPSAQELQQDVDRLLGALDAPINTGLPGRSGGGTRSGLASGARSPYDSSGGGMMRSPVTGGYASGTRTPNLANHSTPGERFSTSASGAPPYRLQHMDEVHGVLKTLDGMTVPMPQGQDGLGWRGHHDGASSNGDFDIHRMQELSPGAFPEQSGLIMPGMDEDYDHHGGADDHPASQAAIQRLHDEMDALLADSSAQPSLTADQQMLLRQNEISSRAQMEAFRVPVTASIDRVMQRDNRMHPNQMPGQMPPQVQRKPDEHDLGFGFRCFRACS